MVCSLIPFLLISARLPFSVDNWNIGARWLDVGGGGLSIGVMDVIIIDVICHLGSLIRGFVKI